MFFQSFWKGWGKKCSFFWKATEITSSELYSLTFHMIQKVLQSSRRPADSGEHLCHKRTSSNSLSVFFFFKMTTKSLLTFPGTLSDLGPDSLCRWWTDMFIFKTKTGMRLWSSSNALGPEGLTSWPGLPYFTYSWLTGPVVNVKVLLEVRPQEYFLYAQHEVRGCPGYKYKYTRQEKCLFWGVMKTFTRGTMKDYRQYAIKC